MANRIYFANQQLSFRPIGAATVPAWRTAHGVQSVGVTTTFNLEQAFELGQLAIYENIEGVPDVEITCSKVLDGYSLLYHLATDEGDHTKLGSSHGPDLAGRSNASVMVALGIWPDTNNSASGDPVQQMECSGMFCSSVSYNFPLEDNFTEDITLVGNNKGWKDGTAAIDCSEPGWNFSTATGDFSNNNDTPKASGTNTVPAHHNTPVGGAFEVAQLGGINRRENMSFAPSNAELASKGTGYDYTRLPSQIPGVNATGWFDAKGTNTAHIQSITVSTDLGREELFEMGTRQPYARVVTFPIEVTCDIECLSVSGDLINAFADGCQYSTDPCTGVVDNLTPETIRIATCEGTRIYLGENNKLASVNYGGGDAGGGNVTVTYSYTTFNDFTVIHPQDPNVSGSGWWASRSGYLSDLAGDTTLV